MNQVLGKNVFTELKVGDQWIPIFCAKTASIDTEQEEIETTSRNSSGDREYEPGMSSATLSCAGITNTSNYEGAVSVFYLLQESVRRSILNVRMRFVDQDALQITLAFSCFVRTLGITRDRISYSQSAVSFRITGPLAVEGTPTPVPPSDCEYRPTIYLTLLEGETLVHSDLLEEANADVVSVSREGTILTYTSGTPGNQEFSHDLPNGDVTFDPGNPGNPGGEHIAIEYQIITP